MDPTTTPEAAPQPSTPPAPSSAPDPSDHKRTLLPLVFGGIGLLLVALFSTIYLKTIGNPLAPAPTATPTPTSAATTEASPSSQTTTLTLDIDQNLLNTLKAGGSSYADPNGIYTILYPSEYKQDTQNEGQYVRIYKQGPTQKGQTEMYDGVIISIESISLSGETLDSFITKKIASESASGATTVEQGKEKVVMNSYPGFTYTTQGLGTFKHIALQKNTDSDSAIDITMLVADPTNAGFQKEVDTIISTLELLK